MPKGAVLSGFCRDVAWHIEGRGCILSVLTRGTVRLGAGSQKCEYGRLKSEDGRLKLEVGSVKLEVGRQKSEVGSRM